MRIIDYPDHTVILNAGTSIVDTTTANAVDTDSLRRLLDDWQPGGPLRQEIRLDWQPDWNDLLRQLFPEQLQTGGGLVVNAKGQVLLIRRLGFWDLPKGKLDAGESPEEAALREVTEETGVEGLELTKPLIVTLHTYLHEGRRILKENHWFGMRTSHQGPLKPQTEEDIETCTWIDPAEITTHWKGMYPSIRRVFEAYGLAGG